MVQTSRNSFSDGTWTLEKIEDLAVCKTFDCNDGDLNEYFHLDVFFHRKELLTQTYYLYANHFPKLILALLDFCNDAVRLTQYKGKVNLDARKQYASLPAVKLTRLGVTKELQRMNIGTNALNMVKLLFLQDNRTGCRFLTVDAYNNPGVISFYQKNGFALLTEKDKEKNTRSLFFDLKRLRGFSPPA